MPESDVPSLDSVREFAYAQRPDMTLINAAVDAARLRHQIAMREFAPDFYIAGRISRAWAPTIEDQTSPFTYDPYNSFGLGILVGMKLDLHPFRAFAQARQAEARIVEAERQREAARLLVDTDVAQAYQRVVGSHQRLEAYEAAYDAARAWLDQKAFQYDQGFADYEDLEDPLKAYYRAAGDRLQAHYNYRVAVADLATKCGADDLTTVPAASQGSSSDEGANRATGADASEGDGSDTGE